MRDLFPRGRGLVFAAAIVLLLHAAAGLCLAQGGKSIDTAAELTAPAAAPREIKLKDADVAKVQNVQLILANLHLQIQNAQLQLEAVKRDVPLMIDVLYQAYRLSRDEWMFDEMKLQFVRKLKPSAP
jgi:hypothetical protein